MSTFNSLPIEATPQLTDRVFTARGTSAGAERRATIAAILALVGNEIGFGVNGGGEVVQSGLRFSRVMRSAGIITGWSIVADQSGSIVMDIRKGTPSGGTVTTASITASATPELSSQQVASSSTLTGWTTSYATGDVIELVITGIPVSVTFAGITLSTIPA